MAAAAGEAAAASSGNEALGSRAASVLHSLATALQQAQALSDALAPAAEDAAHGSYLPFSAAKAAEPAARDGGVFSGGGPKSCGGSPSCVIPRSATAGSSPSSAAAAAGSLVDRLESIGLELSLCLIDAAMDGAAESPVSSPGGGASPRAAAEDAYVPFESAP
mmetsp:Transcript_19640/g.63021  ORF Transcript_19640/g.63021 Transcript_19640/m.63021 type:complete len:163 (+) Transcript_19640:240-728(+)